MKILSFPPAITRKFQWCGFFLHSVFSHLWTGMKRILVCSLSISFCFVAPAATRSSGYYIFSRDDDIDTCFLGNRIDQFKYSHWLHAHSQNRTRRERRSLGLLPGVWVELLYTSYGATPVGNPREGLPLAFSLGFLQVSLHDQDLPHSQKSMAPLTFTFMGLDGNGIPAEAGTFGWC